MWPHGENAGSAFGYSGSPPLPCCTLWGRLPGEGPSARTVGVKWIHVQTAPTACREELPVIIQSYCVWESALSCATLACRNS